MVDVTMRRIDPTPGKLGPDRGLIYESDQLHPLHSVITNQDFHPEFLYRVQFWDCRAVAIYLADEENEFVNPETGHGADGRFFGTLSRVYRKDLHPSQMSEIGGGLQPGQELTFLSGEPPYHPFTVRIQVRGSMNPMLTLVDPSVLPFGMA